jgi:carbonic anhydrase/acetyltransferase-like protein (isoleucine patch superfamily)/Uma2 family endonuclease
MQLDTKFHPEQIHPSVFIAAGAVVVGDVTLGEQASVWFNATLRGDVEAITVGPRSNIQEGCILHADPGYPTVIGAGVTVGHGAVVHGARVGDNCIVGIRAVLLNGSVVGENSIVGACALLTEGKVYPPNSLILGMPARVVRDLTPEEIATNRSSAARYVERAAAFSQAGSSPDLWTEPTWDVALLFPAQGAWSEHEYLALDSNRLVEFSHGRLEVLPMPSDTHQSIVGFLYTVLLAFAQQMSGVVRFAPLRLRLWPGKIREPDLMLLRDANDPRRQDAYWTGADLVVEVVSEDDPGRDLITKRLEYAQAGIPEYWIVDPRGDRITVLRLEGDTYRVHGQFEVGAVATSATLPGLTVAVGSVFQGR